MVAKSFRQEHAIHKSFDLNSKEAYRFGLRRGIVISSIFPVVATASSAGLALLVYASGLSARGAAM